VYEAVNRLINVAVALLGLALLGPLMLVIAALVKLSDPQAPVLYRGQRLGRGAKPFTIFKFRTMVPEAETRIGGQLIGRDSPHITPLGRVLRSRKLDELPQLLNVLRGDMSFVGPRPARSVFAPELRGRVPGYDRRFLVRPGITGLAQVRGGYYTDPRNKLRYELIYIQRRSVWLDIKLVAATLFIMASRTLTMFGLLVSFLAFVVFVPTTFLPMLHVPIFGKPVNVAFLIIAALATAWVSRSVLGGPLVLRRTAADPYIVAFVLWSVLGAVLNSGVGRNLLGVLYMCSSAFVLYFLASQDVRPDTVRVRRHVRMLGGVTVVVSGWGIAEYLIGRQWDESLRVSSLLGNTNVLALYLTMMAPILLHLGSSGERGARRFVWNGCALLTAICLVLTFSWSGYVAGAIALLVWFYAGHRPRVWLGLLVGVFILLAVELVGHERASVRSFVTSPRGLEIVRLYGAVVNGSHDDLVLGVSWRNWRDALQSSGQSMTSSDEELRVGLVAAPRRLRNMYLTWLVEHGIVGLLFMLLIFGAIMRTLYLGSVRIRDRAVSALVWAILAGQVGAMTHMVFFDAAYFIAVQTTFWLLAGFGVGLAIAFDPGVGRRYRWTDAKLLVEVRPGQWAGRRLESGGRRGGPARVGVDARGDRDDRDSQAQLRSSGGTL
jgi:lipopolysaccharide/colanic/teichoic acid biosynthesis glycosyltransferase